MTKDELFHQGLSLLNSFCATNALPVPEVTAIARADWRSRHMCAYYRPVYIHICVSRCAAIGLAGRNWSYPGYVIDRTPFGVLQHELGHHVDTQRSSYRRRYSVELRQQTRDEPITSYAPNAGEWFAEMIRLFITNPNLLAQLRPRTHEALLRSGLKPVVSGKWETILNGAPARTCQAARNKIQRVSC